MEQHKEHQEYFKRLMPVLMQLDEYESEDLLHLIKNKQRSSNSEKQNRKNKLIDEACSDVLKKKLSKISEDENFAVKNAYNHETETMNYAKKEKMPVDSRKVTNAVRQQHLYRAQINNDINTYAEEQENVGFEEGILTFVAETADGDMRNLLNDIGVFKGKNFGNNIDTLTNIEDNALEEYEDKMNIFLNSRFTTIDMTDYEHDYPNWNESTEEISWTNPLAANLTNRESLEGGATIYGVNEVEADEPSPEVLPGFFDTARGILTDYKEGFEDEEFEDLGGDDDDEDEEEEEEVALMQDTIQEGMAGEEIEAPEMSEPAMYKPYERNDNRAFEIGENIYDRHNRSEVDAFMKLLNVKPVTQWYDDTVHHYRMGAKVYEDESQEVDPYFHLLGEVERKHLERIRSMEFRRGTEVKLLVDPKKKPVFVNNSR